MLNRRQFVLSCTAASLAAGCSTPSIGNHRRAKRFHVFSKMFQSPVTKSPEELCDLMAGAGFDGVQWTVRKGGHATPENVKTELPRLVKISKARGLDVETICTAITDGNDSVSETICRVAADCGVRQFRTGYYFYDEKNESFPQSMERFKRAFSSLADLGGRCGIKAAYQNHSTWGPAIFGGAVWDIYECVRDLDPRYIGIEFDPMHAYFENYESWRHGFARVAPWVSSIDLKDFHYALSRKDPRRMEKKMVAAGEGIAPWTETKEIVERMMIDPLYILHFEYDFDKTHLKETVSRELNVFRKAMAGQ